jgi:hypothetical protein
MMLASSTKRRARLPDFVHARFPRAPHRQERQVHLLNRLNGAYSGGYGGGGPGELINTLNENFDLRYSGIHLHRF